ncbi:multicopper oxidase family protein [Chelativorans salis]|uniref:Multicopper oxidase family protein n=1 Tax=Chelativorans salis TaxID=2978478 RepID=A0ABT2LQD2_9HYPH|nr:multicopper oxidase family protein [Chelativorans sp. EGI FJ00035]MCT7375588.1 multicopper oxidase family protein [Chelativorans sp. EGI FJ00035]
MSNRFSNTISRRRLLQAGAGFAAMAFPTFRPGQATAGSEYRITAKPARVPLIGGGYPETAVWSYDGAVPGPEIRVRQGERLRVAVENRLDEETTVHWHGLRVPNAMDGVPHLTQAPIAPGETFVYAFDCPDAGTFWYHPHQRGSEQVDRGLYGPLIVEEPEPIVVDRDVTWVLDDWRLLPDGQISDDFGNMMDAGMAGRIGNTATVNGRLAETFAVSGGERVRLRLINAANARIFALTFEGHHPRIVALDGQPVEPHAPDNGRVVLGPAMRADLVIDMTGAPGARFRVIDTFYRNLEYRLLDLVYADRPLREAPPDRPIRLSDNPLAEPDIATAETHEVTFGGGMMSGMMGGGMTERGMSGQGMMGMMGRMMEGMRHGGVWTVNGIAAEGHVMDPMLTLARSRSYILALHNDTAWHHPIHLHGHSFRVLGREGAPTRHREWQDTVLMAPRERVEIAFVADNPGDWMFHCHILEHQSAGMMGVIRVT